VTRRAAVLEKAGGSVLANACGPCIGQWNRNDVAKGVKNSIITSFNRRARVTCGVCVCGRAPHSPPPSGTSLPATMETYRPVLPYFKTDFCLADAPQDATHSFVASPEIVTVQQTHFTTEYAFYNFADQALVFAGSMTFNPATDTIPDKDGKPFKFKAPYGIQLPAAHFHPTPSRHPALPRR
jgi:aconitate hydratase